MTDETHPTPAEPETATGVAEQLPAGAAPAAAEGAQEKAGEPAAAEEREQKPAKLHQRAEMNDAGPCKKHIKVTVDRADIDKRLEEKFSELVGDSTVPGFRPGKAPRKIIVRRFHKDVSDQVKAQVLLESLEQLAEENDVAPLSAPD